VPDRFDPFDDIFGPDGDIPGTPRHRPRHRDHFTRHPMRCPSFAVLMAYADEHDLSLTPRRRARIREHVYRCEECFTHVERASEDVLHDVHEILKDAYDFQAASRRREEGFKKALQEQIKLNAQPPGLSHPVRKWLFMIAASLAFVAIGTLMIRETTAVIHAETLIDRAVAYERAHAGEPRYVRQSRGATMPAARGPVTSGVVTSGLGTSGGGESMHPSDRRHPFCVTCYQAWRASLSRKRDTVMLTGDMFVLRTTTPEGSLREMTLMLHRDTYRLVQQMFQFEGMSHIAFEEREDQTAPVDQRGSTARAVVDAGTGTLAPTISSRPPAPAAGDLARPASRVQLSRWLDRTFLPSSSAARSTFLPDIERRTSAVRQHLIALQRLANLSDTARLKDGTDEERAKLNQQVELEYQAMVTHLRALEDSLTLLLGTGNRAAEFRTPVPADWQRRASTALPHATRLQHRLHRIFMFEDLPREETQASRPRSARAAFEALWASIHGNPDRGQ
jgi:hypothetical protein